MSGRIGSIVSLPHISIETIDDVNQTLERFQASGDLTRISTDLNDSITYVSHNSANPNKDPKKYQEMIDICSSAANYLELLQEALKIIPTSEIPQNLKSLAARSFAVLCMFLPSNVATYERDIAKLLDVGDITSSRLNLREYEYHHKLSGTAMVIVKLYSCFNSSEDFQHWSKTLHGQDTAVQPFEVYASNYPLEFIGRTLGQFNGDKLLIGGGENCGCGLVSERHPKEEWYSADIDPQRKSDVRADLVNNPVHASYLPKDRFKTIYFEHVPLISNQGEIAGILGLVNSLKERGIVVVDTTMSFDSKSEVIKAWTVMARFQQAGLRHLATRFYSSTLKKDTRVFSRLIFCKDDEKQVTQDQIKTLINQANEDCSLASKGRISHRNDQAIPSMGFRTTPISERNRQERIAAAQDRIIILPVDQASGSGSSGTTASIEAPATAIQTPETTIQTGTRDYVKVALMVVAIAIFIQGLVILSRKDGSESSK